MARSEARISVEIWDDPDFLRLSPMAQRAYMFLLSQRDLAYTGVVPLRERRWASKAAGMTAATIQENLAELDAARFVVVDEDAEELLIRAFIRQDRVYRQPQLIRSAADSLAMVTSARIRAELAQELRRVLEIEGLHEASKEAVEQMLTDIGDPESRPEAPCGDPARTLPAPSNDHGQERQGKGVSNHLGLSSPTPEPPAPDPTKTPPESSRRAPRAAATKRGTRIPDDFAVTPEMVEWAREKTPRVDGRRETEKFINYWQAKTGKDATKLDWVATWRNWMLNAAERLGNTNGSRASPGPYRNPTDPDAYEWKRPQR